MDRPKKVSLKPYIVAAVLLIIVFAYYVGFSFGRVNYRGRANSLGAPANEALNALLFSGHCALDSLQRASAGPSAAVGNPGTRDAWMARMAEGTLPGSLVLDVSSGARPYRHLWSHCSYKSHEFNGNAAIVDAVRGESSDTRKDLQNVHDYVGDITATGAPSSAFDVVLLTEVFEHVPRPLEAMAELARVAKPGANIYVSAPFTSGSHQQPYHFSAGLSLEWYKYAAEATGLQIISTESQGDYFKLMAQEIDRVLKCGTVDPGLGSDVEEVRRTLFSYLLKLSSLHGDGAEHKSACANAFTIGWMVHLRKNA